MIWLSRLVGPGKRRAAPRRHTRSRLRIEGLEDRCVPAGVAHPTFTLLHHGGAHPNSGSAGPSGLTPSAIRSAYGITGDGSNQTIAIVDAYDQPNVAADLHAFDAYYGLSDPPSLVKINENGGSSLPRADVKGGWGVETSLDVEWAHVVAPKASIVLVEANSASYADLMAAVNAARNYAGVGVVSMSWGGDESSSLYPLYDSYFTTPGGHQGVTFVASSGDSGAYSASGSGSKVVEYPASSPNVLGVGGTTLTTSGGSYVSESGWGNGTRSYSSGGSGGGVSKYASQPGYQGGVVTQSATKRAVPDVSFDADPSSGVPVYDTYDNTPSTPWVQVGGTSLASPMWAGVIALADQARAQNGLGTLDGRSQTLPALYSLPSADFHDVTSGNNGYAAGAGYDLVTGRGTPTVNKVVSGLAGGSSSTPTPSIGSFAVNPASVKTGGTVTLTASNVTETGGAISSVRFYLESNGTSGLQAGTDTLVGTGTQNGTTWTLSNLSTSGLSPGSYTLYAVATDSAGTSSATAAATLTVTATSSMTATSTTLTAGPVTYNGNYTTAYATLTATVTAASGAVDGGTVSLIYNGTTIASGTVHVVNGVGTVSFNVQMSSSPYYWYYYTFTAAFSGTSDESPSSGSLTLPV